MTNRTPPVDATELVVILCTAGAAALLYGVLVAVDSDGTLGPLFGWSLGWVAPTLLITGVICIVGGLIVKGLAPKAFTGPKAGL